MWNDVIRLLIMGGLGAVIGLILQKLAPTTFRKAGAWANDPRRSTLFVLGFIFFGLCAGVNFTQGNIVHGIAGVGLAILQIVSFVITRRKRLNESQ